MQGSEQGCPCEPRNLHKIIQRRVAIEMTPATTISCLFLDIGGVLLTDGWGHLARKRAARTFKLQWAEMEARHNLVFETYENGRLTLEEYLGRVVFYRKRAFTRAQFRRFMFAQSKPYPQMIELLKLLKARCGLKIVAVNNEAREMNAYRIQEFLLDEWMDCFVSSCFVHLRKPDVNIFRLALDIARVQPREVLYIENTPMFVQVAEDLGIRGVVHQEFKSTRSQLASFGLSKIAGDGS